MSEETTVVVQKDCPYNPFYLVPLADFHLGAGGGQAVAVEIIRGYLDWIKEHENAYTILNGDLQNCAGKDTTPELFDDLVTPDESYYQVRALVEPIKDKILMITRGGHEGMVFRRVGTDYSARLAYDLDIPYRPDGGMVQLKMVNVHGRFSFFVYATHGWGGARTIGAKVKKVEDLAMGIDADVYVLSHDHTQAVHRINQLAASGHKNKWGQQELIPHRKVLVNTGGFVKYDGYVARKGLVPQDLGTPRIRCEVKESNGRRYKDIHCSI